MTAKYILNPAELNDGFLASIKTLFKNNSITITIEDSNELSPEMKEKLAKTSFDFDNNKGFEVDFESFLKEQNITL